MRPARGGNAPFVGRATRAAGARVGALVGTAATLAAQPATPPAPPAAAAPAITCADLPDADPGTQRETCLTVPAGADGPALALPVVVVRGPAPGPTLVVTAGVHGAEYAPVVARARRGQRPPARRASGQTGRTPATAYSSRVSYTRPARTTRSARRRSPTRSVGRPATITRSATLPGARLP